MTFLESKLVPLDQGGRWFKLLNFSRHILVVIGSCWISSCTTIEYGQGNLDVTSTPKNEPEDLVNHSLNRLDHTVKNMQATEWRLLDKTGAGCATGATLGAARTARDKAIKESPNAPTINYKYKVYGSDEVGGSHCGVIVRTAHGNRATMRGDQTAKGDINADVEIMEYGFNLRNGYDYGEFAWGVELALLFGSYRIGTYPINYYDLVSKKFYDRTAKYKKDYAVIPLEIFTTYSPEQLWGLGFFVNVGTNLGTFGDIKYALGPMYSFGLGDQWLLQAKLRIARYTTTMVGKKATIDERLALVGISYLVGGDK